MEERGFRGENRAILIEKCSLLRRVVQASFFSMLNHAPNQTASSFPLRARSGRGNRKMKEANK